VLDDDGKSLKKSSSMTSKMVINNRKAAHRGAKNFGYDIIVCFLKNHQITGVFFNHPTLSRPTRAAINLSAFMFTTIFASILQDNIIYFDTFFNAIAYIVFIFVGFIVF
jgi:hypothetical protein